MQCKVIEGNKRVLTPCFLRMLPKATRNARDKGFYKTGVNFNKGSD